VAGQPRLQARRAAFGHSLAGLQAALPDGIGTAPEVVHSFAADMLQGFAAQALGLDFGQIVQAGLHSGNGEICKHAGLRVV
jgi:hypothetical protein